MLGRFQLSGCRGCRVGTMSKVELAGRPEPGYESMEQFAVSVEHVADMLRTINFQSGEGGGMGGGGGPPGTGRAASPGGDAVGNDGQKNRDSSSRGLPSAQAPPGRKRMRR